MHANFLISPEELTVDFLEGLKKTFTGKSKLRILVDEEMDETEYVEKYYGESIRRSEIEYKAGKSTVFENTDELKEWLARETTTTF